MTDAPREFSSSARDGWTGRPALVWISMKSAGSVSAVVRTTSRTLSRARNPGNWTLG